MVKKATEKCVLEGEEEWNWIILSEVNYKNMQLLRLIEVVALLLTEFTWSVSRVATEQIPGVMSCDDEKEGAPDVPYSLYS